MTAPQYNDGIDLGFFHNETINSYDLTIKDGELVLEDDFDSTILASLFSDQRAEPFQQPNNLQKRGWWGDLIGDVANYQLGSQMWVLEQSRLTQDTLNKAEDFARNALLWFVEQGIAQSVEVTGSFIENGIRLEIIMIRENNIVETRFYDVWINTGGNNV